MSTEKRQIFGDNIDVLLPGTNLKLRVLKHVELIGRDMKQKIIYKVRDIVNIKEYWIDEADLIRAAQKHDDVALGEYMILRYNSTLDVTETISCCDESELYYQLGKTFRTELDGSEKIKQIFLGVSRLQKSGG